MQIRQLTWHKYDFIDMGILATLFFVYSIAVFVSTARGHHHSLLMMSICAGYVACAVYALARSALCLCTSSASVVNPAYRDLEPVH